MHVPYEFDSYPVNIHIMLNPQSKVIPSQYSTPPIQHFSIGSIHFAAPLLVSTCSCIVGLYHYIPIGS